MQMREWVRAADWPHGRGSRMLGVVAVACVAAALLSIVARAQEGDLVRQGQWTVNAPAGGCGSLPLLQVKGPGTLFDAGNAAELASLQGAIANALGKVCPGVSEAILANGRTRKLVRLNAVAQRGSGVDDEVRPPASVPATGPGRASPINRTPGNAAVATTERQLPADGETRLFSLDEAPYPACPQRMAPRPSATYCFAGWKPARRRHPVAVWALCFPRR